MSSTAQPHVTSFADVKREFVKSLDTSASKRIVPMIAASTALGLASLGGRITSAVKGHDVSYVSGVRPMTPRRHAQNGFALALGALSLGLNVRELAARHNRPIGNYGQRNAEMTDLVGTLISGPAIGAIAVRELVRGKSTLRGYRTSTYGKAIRVASLVNLGASTALAGYELYRRREQWLPKLQEHAQTARVMAPIVLAQAKAKVTGSEPEPASMSEEDLDRLFATALRHGGSVNTDPDGVGDETMEQILDRVFGGTHGRKSSFLDEMYEADSTESPERTSSSRSDEI